MQQFKTSFKMLQVSKPDLIRIFNVVGIFRMLISIKIGEVDK